MPYPNVKPNSKQEKQIESCVGQIMSDSKFKPRKGRTKKESAIAICIASVMGKSADSSTQSDTDIFSNNDIDVGKEVTNMAKIQKDKKVKGEDLEVKKQDPAEEVKADEVKEDVVVDESPKEEVAEEKAEVVEEVKEEEKVEAPAEEEKPAEEPVEEKPAEEEVKADVATGEDKLSKILDIVSKLGNLVKQDVPAEEVKEEVSSGEEPAVEAVEEKPAEEVKEEVIEEEKAVVEEKVAVDGADAFQKVEGLIFDLSKKVDEKFETLEKRVAEIEAQPAPSKVFSPTVVTKGDVKTENSGRIEEIDKRLKELEDLKNSDMKKYQSGRMWEEAMKLIDEKSTLL